MSSGLPFKHSVEMRPVRPGEEVIEVKSRIDLQVCNAVHYVVCATKSSRAPASHFRQLEQQNEQRLLWMVSEALGVGALKDVALAAHALEKFLGENCGTTHDWPCDICCDNEESAKELSRLLSKLHECLIPFREQAAQGASGAQL